MIKPNAGLEARLRDYAAGQDCTLIDFLGGGQDGDVWKSSRPSAIKAFHFERAFWSELTAYRRLRSYGVRQIMGMVVPRLIDWDENLRIVEVDFVSPPYIIDFGKCYFDAPPDYSPEVWQDYHAQQQEIWEERYGDVQGIIYKLRAMGIHYVDASPKNINFGSLPRPT